MIYRLTNALSKKIRDYPKSVAPCAGNPFIDWAATLFTVERYQYVLLTNRQSLLSWAFYGKGVNDTNAFIRKANEAVRDCLEHHGFEFIYETHVVPAIFSIRFSKVGDRSVDGILNELVKQARSYTVHDDLAPCEIGPRLNEIPQCARDNPWPVKAFGEMQVAS